MFKCAILKSTRSIVCAILRHTPSFLPCRYRLLAIDHDLLSFTDTRLDQWPLVLITNPKDAHFIVPSREPTKRMTHSTHIRLLAFSPDTITTVTVWVDGEKLTTPVRSVGGALYTFPWQPAKYAAGLHTIRVHVKVICLSCQSRIARNF